MSQMPDAPQSLSVKRAQVEFHNFASLGEPSRVLPHYLDENRRRGRILERNLDFIGPLTPFLEIGANAGHTSYLLANQFGADGFALDLSADALRHGTALLDLWQLARSPVRIAGDAINLPFRDGSVRFVMACQMLSQFMDIESVFIEVKRVLMPGGVFLFTEEPLRRRLSLRLRMRSVHGGALQHLCHFWFRQRLWQYPPGLRGFDVDRRVMMSLAVQQEPLIKTAQAAQFSCHGSGIDRMAAKML